MGLKESTCTNCKTKYFANVESVEYDGLCFMCSTTRKFLKMFDLEDLDINEVDFNRVRMPKFEECSFEIRGWKIEGHPKDWRVYIPQGLKDMWDRLPVESRMLAIMFAEREARKC